MSFPFSGITVTPFRGALPARADVVVIGGGIIGITAAIAVAAQGVSVVVLEKGRVGAEQSTRNWGWIRTQGRVEPEIPIALEAERIWADLAPRLGRDIGLAQVGTLYLAQNQADMARFADWLKMAEPYGVSSALVSAAQVADLLPGAARGWAGGITTPTDGRAEPWVAVPAMADYARSQGVQIIEGCAVRLLDLASGRVAGVVTEAGVIKTSSVVLAGGAWSTLLLRNHGIDLPQLSVRATVGATAALAPVNAGPASQWGLAWRRRDDHGYTIAPSRREDFYIGPDAFRHFWQYRKILARNWRGLRFRATSPKGYPDGWGTPRQWGADDETPFERMRILDPSPNQRELQRAVDAFGAIFPALGDIKQAAGWAGMIDTLPDEIPVIDHVAKIPGLTLCTGMSGHGFGAGPAFGRIAAALATGGQIGQDISAFRFSRFD